MLDSIPSFTRLVAELAKFPGIGTKTATRLAFFLLRQPDAEAAALAEAIVDLKRNTRFCSVCFHITEQDPCTLCADPTRDGSLLCVVEEPQAVLAVERSRSFRGRSFDALRPRSFRRKLPRPACESDRSTLSLCFDEKKPADRRGGRAFSAQREKLVQTRSSTRPLPAER